MNRFGAELEEIRYEGQPSAVYFGLPLYEKVDIQAMIDEAVAAGRHELTIPRGAYRLTPKRGNTHVLFDRVSDFTLHAYDVVFLYQDMRAGGMTLNNCHNVTVEGLSSDYEPFGYSQMRIIAIDPEGQYIDFHIDEGYISDFSDVYGLAFFPSSFYRGDTRRYMQLRPFDVTNKNVEDLGNRNVRVHAPLASDHKASLHIGDYLCASVRPVLGGNLGLRFCSGCQIKDYTVWAGCVGVGESYSTGKNFYDRFNVVPGPRPYRASEDRICSTVADAAHMMNTRVGATMENGIYLGMGDDGVNFYGTFARVAEVISDTEFVLAERHAAVRPLDGDILRFYANDMSFVGDGGIESASRMPEDYQPVYDLSKALGVTTFRPEGFYRVTLKKAVSLAEGNFISVTTRNGNGFVLRNNRYINARPRGCVIKGSEGLVENCFFEDLATGIQICPSIPWNEAGYIQNVTVRGNTFVRMGTGILVGGHLARDQRNVLLENNTFLDVLGPEMQITASQNITVRGNRFGEGSLHNNAKPVIVVGAADGVFFENNSFADKSRTCLSLSPGAENVCGMEGGLPYAVASDAVESGVQGYCDWHFGYAMIGTHDYTDYPVFRYETTCPDGWHTEDGNDADYGTVTRFWKDVYMRPGNLADAVKTYLCPMDGEVAVSATNYCLPGEPTEDGIRLMIYHGEALLWEKELMQNELVTPPVLLFSVKAGDAIHFRVNKRGSTKGDGTAWNPTVLYRSKK